MGSGLRINNKAELADVLGINVSTLTYVLYVRGVDSFYHSFEIPKKSGGIRRIHAPVDQLRYIQEKIYTLLWNHQTTLHQEMKNNSNIAHAFIKEKSTTTNAQIHRNKYVVLNVDLESFFESFHFGRVAGYFEKNRYFALPHDIAIMIAQLTCYHGSLPQGAPTSPIITNLICQILDYRILKLAKKYKMDYTRYADDMTFSTNNRAFIEKKDGFLNELGDIIQRAGFSVNRKKTRISLKDSQQIATGLVVNKKIAVPAAYYRETRAMAHHLYRYGYFTIDGKRGSLAQLEGRFSYITQYTKNNSATIKDKYVFQRALDGREREYRKFLFYKYFYVNEKPLVLTEGKTDIRYIKAALKKLYLEYPTLITKDETGEYIFHIDFLNRFNTAKTKNTGLPQPKKLNRLVKYFGLFEDGAEPMKNLIEFYKYSTSNLPNYYCEIKHLSNRNPQHPVILLFDNEMDKNYPLGKIVSKLKAEDIKRLQSELRLHFIEDSNLFLATNPLREGEKCSVIESLFDKETLALKIEGKSLSLNNEYNNEMFYGKEVFSWYVMEHADQIDFSGFRGLLNVLVAVIEDYKRFVNNNESA